MRPLLIKLLLRLFSWLPLRAAHVLGALIGWLFTLKGNKLCHITSVNIELCFPGMSESQRAQLTRRSMIETGKTFAETGTLWLGDASKVLTLIKQVTGDHLVRDVLAQGKGVILTAPHLGAWELAGLYCSAHYPLTSLYRPPRMRELDGMIRIARQRLGAKLVPTDASGIRALYKALDKGEAIGILPDQEPGAGNGIFVPFFGVPAYTMVLLSRLAMKTGAPVIFTYAERLPRGAGFHLRFVAGPPAINEGPLEESARGVNAALEQCISALPEQYQWSYKRFRNRPAGETRFY
ncbi:MAG: lysophospholipid acyltransferase family protein [Pseudomonadota bacterium]